MGELRYNWVRISDSGFIVVIGREAGLYPRDANHGCMTMKDGIDSCIEFETEQKPFYFDSMLYSSVSNQCVKTIYDWCCMWIICVDDLCAT